MPVIVKNTFIDVAEDLNGAQVPSAQRRSSSAPPGSKPCAENIEEAVSGVPDEGAETCSPRSDNSTTASSEGAAPPVREADSCVPTAQPACGEAEVEAEAEVEPFGDDCSDPGTLNARDFEVRDFHLCINKMDNPQLGIDVKRSDGITLLIRSVSGSGLVGKWNEDNPSLEVRIGDHIVTVNGISGNATEMLRECKRCQVLHIRIISNLSREVLGTLVGALRGSHVRQAAVAAANRLRSQQLALTPQAIRDNEVVDHTGTGQVTPPEASNPDGKKPIAPELSLVNLLTNEEAVSSQQEADAAASYTPNQPSSKTRLKSSAPAFTPTFAGPGQGPAGEAVVAQARPRGEIGAVLKSVARALSFNPDVQNVQITESDLGASSAVHIELPPLHANNAASVQVVRALAKGALLDAAAQSLNTYVIGYLNEPFTNVGDYSFKAVMASMPDSETACWSFYQKGRCGNENSCRRFHPGANEMSVVWVHLQHSSR